MCGIFKSSPKKRRLRLGRKPSSARASITPDVMERMLDADNGISTSAFSLYKAPDGKVAINLNNFCKLQDLGADDEDDILSCVHFLLVDVMSARRLLSGLKS